MAEPDSSPSGPSPVDALTQRLGLGNKAWGRRLSLALLLLVVSVAAGFVISPWIRPIP
jgi:hypothetical protein